jgi:sugar-specific transcriptional regulator TrmB
MNLEPLNLSKIEEKILENIIKNDNLTAKQLTDRISHDKKVVYDNIEKLQRKGLIFCVTENGVRHYSFSGEKSIFSLLEHQESELSKRKEKVKILVSEISKIRKEKITESKTELYIGKQGIRQIFYDLLENTKQYYVIGTPIESENIMGKYFWDNFHLKQKEKNIKAKLIFNSSLKTWKTDNKNLEIKYFDVEPMTETIIYKDTVAIIVWSSDPSGTIIRNKEVAKSYFEFFNILWRKSK